MCVRRHIPIGFPHVTYSYLCSYHSSFSVCLSFFFCFFAFHLGTCLQSIMISVLMGIGTFTCHIILHYLPSHSYTSLDPLSFCKRFCYFLWSIILLCILVFWERNHMIFTRVFYLFHLVSTCIFFFMAKWYIWQSNIISYITVTYHNFFIHP